MLKKKNQVKDNFGALIWRTIFALFCFMKKKSSSSTWGNFSLLLFGFLFNHSCFVFDLSPKLQNLLVILVCSFGWYWHSHSSWCMLASCVWFLTGGVWGLSGRRINIRASLPLLLLSCFCHLQVQVSLLLLFPHLAP